MQTLTVRVRYGRIVGELPKLSTETKLLCLLNAENALDIERELREGIRKQAINERESI